MNYNMLCRFIFACFYLRRGLTGLDSNSEHPVTWGEWQLKSPLKPGLLRACPIHSWSQGWCFYTQFSFLLPLLRLFPTLSQSSGHSRLYLWFLSKMDMNPMSESGFPCHTLIAVSGQNWKSVGGIELGRSSMVESLPTMGRAFRPPALQTKASIRTKIIFKAQQTHHPQLHVFIHPPWPQVVSLGHFLVFLELLVKEQAVYGFSVSYWKRLNILVMSLHVILLSYCLL